MHKRWQLLQALTDHYGYRDYLEIGTGTATTLLKLKINRKWGVDPHPRVWHPGMSVFAMTSDAFFEENDRHFKQDFDLIFVDGLHHAGQTLADIWNALEWLRPNGTIVCHDMNPPSEGHQVVPRQQEEWTGDCWKAWIELRRTRSDLHMQVVDMDFGCGVIRRGQQDTIEAIEYPMFDDLVEHRQEWLNLVSPQDFLNELHGL